MGGHVNEGERKIHIIFKLIPKRKKEIIGINYGVYVLTLLLIKGLFSDSL
jgi:hypothetical protein